MKPLINQLTAAVSGAVLFVAAIAMAGLGFLFLGALALFGFMALGLALLATPFARARQNVSQPADEIETHTRAEVPV